MLILQSSSLRPVPGKPSSRIISVPVPLVPHVPAEAPGPKPELRDTIHTADFSFPFTMPSTPWSESNAGPSTATAQPVTSSGDNLREVVLQYIRDNMFDVGFSKKVRDILAMFRKQSIVDKMGPRQHLHPDRQHSEEEQAMLGEQNQDTELRKSFSSASPIRLPIRDNSKRMADDTYEDSRDIGQFRSPPVSRATPIPSMSRPHYSRVPARSG
jgi:hypothetical protein